MDPCLRRIPVLRRCTAVLRRAVWLGATLAIAVAAGADELVLKDGRRLQGTLVERSPYVITFEIGAGANASRANFRADDVQEVITGSPAAKLPGSAASRPAAPAARVPGPTAPGPTTT